MIKSLKLYDRSVRPFSVSKNWNLDLYSNPCLILMESGEPIHLTYTISSQNIEITSSLATEHQTDLNRIQVSYGRPAPTGLFYESSSQYYNPTTNPIDWSGHYQQSIYNVVKSQFYNENRSENFGIENIGRNPNGDYLERREIHDQITIGKIPRNTFGEKIAPNSFTLTDYSTPNQIFVIKDDGVTNLFVDNPARIGSTLSQFTERTDLKYELDTDRFGYSIDADGGYLIVGSPMFSSSYGQSKTGRANLFRFDPAEKKYRFMKEFYFPNSQEALMGEFGLDILIDSEQGGFLLASSGSSLEESVIDEFGYSTAVDDSFLVVGAPNAVFNTTSSFLSSGSGMVFVYDRYKGGDDNWGLINVFSGSTDSDRFGSDVDIDGDRLVIGAEGVNGNFGEAYVYSKKTYMETDPCITTPTSSGDPYFVSGNYSWVLEDILTPYEPLEGFGGTVSIDGDIIVIGSKIEQTTQKVFVYEFQQSGSTCVTGSWTSTCALSPSVTSSKLYTGVISKNTSSLFGYSIDINDNIIVVGDPRANSYQLYSDIETTVTSGSITVLLEDDASVDNTGNWTPEIDGLQPGTLTFDWDTDQYDLTLLPDPFVVYKIISHNTVEFAVSQTYNYSIDVKYTLGGSGNPPYMAIVGASGSQNLVGTTFEQFGYDMTDSWKTYTGSFDTNFLTTAPDYSEVGLGFNGNSNDVFSFKNLIIWQDPTGSSSSSVENNPPVNIGSAYVYKTGLYTSGCCDFCQEFPTSSTLCDWGIMQTMEGDTSRKNNFGNSVSLDGPVLMISSPFEISLSASYDNGFKFEKSDVRDLEGKAYIYTLDDDETIFTQVEEISRDSLNGDPYQLFGYDCSLDNDHAFLSGPMSYTNFSNQDEFTSSLFLENNLNYNYEGNVYTYKIKNVGDDIYVGNIFYKNGLIVLTNTSSVFTDILSDSYEISFQSEYTIHEEEYVLTVEPGEFNVSQNPTALVSPSMIYDINGDGIFDFEDVDLILRYINKYKVYINRQSNSTRSDSGLIMEQDLFDLDSPLSDADLIRRSIKHSVNDESWWNSDILMTESEDVLLNEDFISEDFFTDPKLSEIYINRLITLEQEGYLDINGDGVVDGYDANIILKYYNKIRTVRLIDGNMTEGSTRTTAREVRELLDSYTGVNQDKLIHPNFYGYIESSSYDKTGSYLSPFVTSIGLYDDDYNMVGVAKLGTPIKILKDYPMNFIVSWDK